MQYKSTKKIMLDQRKLETLFRIGCPDNLIIELLKTGKFVPTGDSLIDDNLETLIDHKIFNNTNWGGKREGAGRPKNNQDENQVEFQDENQDGFQDKNQDADKDMDNINNNNIYNTQDNNKLSGIKEEIKKETTKEKNNEENTFCNKNSEDRTLEIQFNTFWEVFPKQRKAGKTKPRQKFYQIVKSKQATAEQLIKAAEDYAKSDTVIRGYAKEPYSWLLNERYLCDYTTQIRPMPQMSLKEMKQMQNEIELEKIRRGEK